MLRVRALPLGALCVVLCAACRCAAPAAPPPSGRAAVVTLTTTPMSSAGAPAPVGFAATLWTGAELLFFAHESSVNERTAEPGGASWRGFGFAYDVSADRWRALPGAPPSRVPGFGEAVVVDGRVFVAGAGEAYFYDARSGAVRAASTKDMPPSATLTAIGARVLAWSSRAAAVYDPAGDAWRATSVPPDIGAVDGRFTAWTGARFVAFRTWQRDRAVVGVVYDPGADRFAITSEDGAPQQLVAGPVPWHGSVYVTASQGPESGIWRYDVAADRWTRLSDTLCSTGALYLVDDVLLTRGPPRMCGLDLRSGRAVATDDRTGAGLVEALAGDDVITWGREETSGIGGGMPPVVRTMNTGSRTHIVITR